jgi:C-terminal processing protease CtpA/Prc
VAFGTDKTVKKLLETFMGNGKKRLILDLRNNPGGSMLETRNILNFFIDK